MDAGGADVASDGFVLAVSPTHLTMDPGDSFPVTITLTRGAAFTDAVDVTINGLNPPYLTAPATTTITGTSVIVQIALPQAPPSKTDLTLSFVGVATNGQTAMPAQLGVHVGSLLVVATADTSLDIPSFATSVLVKAWGAGGGGSVSITDTATDFNGGSGGGGGFASGTVPVTGGETLAVWVGGGGPTNGNGGGLSALVRGSSPLVVAGGGGGAGLAFEVSKSGHCTFGGANANGGAAGGGVTGESTSGAAASGTADAGGAGGPMATNGSALRGGSGGGVSSMDGGLHGGGSAGGSPSNCAASGGGGGGGGWFGGGGGGYVLSTPGGGGGGGSGYVEPIGSQPVLTTGVGQAVANATDADYALDAGAGGSAGVWSCTPSCVQIAPTSGSGGLVVVRLTKP